MGRLSVCGMNAAVAPSAFPISTSRAAAKALLECDRYAESNNDPGTTAGLAGVMFKGLDSAKAKPACEAAYADNSDKGRVAFQLARVEAETGIP